MKHLNKLVLLALPSLLLLAGCKKDDEQTTDVLFELTNKSVVLSVDLEAQGLYPFHVVKNAQTGTADIDDAQELMESDGGILVTTKNKYVYVNDYTGETFKKLEVNDQGVLTEVGSVPNLGVNGSPLHTFLDNNSILLTSKQLWPSDGVYSYQVINTSSMTEEDAGTFTLPILGDDHVDYSFVYATDYVYFEGKVYVPFIESDVNDAAIYDSAGVAVYNATTMNFEKAIYTTSTASLCNGFNPSYAVTESGDLYLCSSNTRYYGNNESVPSGIVRINAGTTDFDDTYFFDISGDIDYHTLGMLYLGSNKVIVQVFNTDATNDYYVEYYLGDLVTKDLEKLDIPASLAGYYGTRRSMALLGNGNAAIISNNIDGSAVYIYNPTTNEVSKGVEYTGADAIVGLKAF